jgi:hypothetical protein
MHFDIRASEKLLGEINRESGGNMDLQTKITDVAILLSLARDAVHVNHCGHREDISWQTTEVYVYGVARQHRHKEVDAPLATEIVAIVPDTSERRIKDVE